MHVWIFPLIKVHMLLLQNGLWELACKFCPVHNQCKNLSMHIKSIGNHAKKMYFAQDNSVKCCFWSSHVCLGVHQIVQNFDSLYNILHILIQLIQISFLVTYFCAQAVVEVLFSNTFPTQKKVEF